jgi:hypothetical protein
VHPSSGRAGASFDKNRFLRKSCATIQLKALASTLIACHFFGMLAGRALWLLVPIRDCPSMRFALELIGIAFVCCRRNIEPPVFWPLRRLCETNSLVTIFLPKTALGLLARPQQRELDLGLRNGKVTYVTWAVPTEIEPSAHNRPKLT